MFGMHGFFFSCYLFFSNLRLNELEILPRNFFLDFDDDTYEVVENACANDISHVFYFFTSCTGFFIHFNVHNKLNVGFQKNAIKIYTFSII